MPEVDPWEKAAECAQAIEATDDPNRREMLTHLRDLWVTMANERHLVHSSELTNQLAGLAKIHAGLLPPTPN